MAKLIVDVGFYELKRQLEYKANWYGRVIVEVPEEYASTQLCHICGSKNPNIGSKRKWTCPTCGAEHDRDINAAINIKNEGLRQLA